ncbi:unnamed protein product [Parnassius apollo]|uniref:(apollo) hypothetical protein n=1 Tax=Parnassius apollo TaxID=110799 RepID=A0A8S3WEP1_PARAO|nr:unnamed protein product [Parnassius apollo]
MTLKLLIYMSLIIRHVNSQRSQTPIMYQQNVPDIYNSGQIFFENSHYIHPQINLGYTIDSHDKFSREYDKNTRQILVDNRFEPNNKESYGQPQIQTQQTIYQHTVQPDQKIYSEDNIHSDGTRTTIAETIIDEDISSKFGKGDTGKLSQNTNFNNKTFAITSFGLKLLKGMSRDPGNILASPYSIAMLLALIQQDTLQLDTLAVLVNAIYFKGIWETKFRTELTKPKTFYLSNGSRKVVPFMHARRMFQTDIDPEINSKVLLIPFEKAQYSMMIILPFEGVNALDVLSSLTEQKLYAYQTFTAKEVQLEILNFVSNFSKGVHNAVLSIDEQGGSAAAATAFSVVALSNDDSAITFRVIRPFLIVLWDSQLNVPLFMGKIEDPTS